MSYDVVMKKILITISALTLFIPLAVFADNTLGSGLVEWWSFDTRDYFSATVVTDRSGGNKIATLTNAPTNVAGKIGQAIKLNGSTQLLTASNVASVPVAGTARTMTAWIKKAVTAGGTIITTNTASGQKFVFQSFNNGSENIFTDGVNVGNNLTVSGANIPPVGVWSHVAFTLDASNHWAYYLNGTKRTSGTFGTSINTNTASSVTLGDRLDAGGQKFNGTLDDVRMYNRQLSDNEVYMLYREGGGNRGDSFIGTLIETIGGIL